MDRLTHCLQTATLAHKDGKDEEYVVCALLHDIGDTLGPANHADIAAVLLQPYVSEENHWMVKHHAVFQGYYFFEYLGLDKNMREQYRITPYMSRLSSSSRNTMHQHSIPMLRRIRSRFLSLDSARLRETYNRSTSQRRRPRSLTSFGKLLTL